MLDAFRLMLGTLLSTSSLLQCFCSSVANEEPIGVGERQRPQAGGVPGAAGAGQGSPLVGAPSDGRDHPANRRRCARPQRVGTIHQLPFRGGDHSRAERRPVQSNFFAIVRFVPGWVWALSPVFLVCCTSVC